ncbi:glycosyltransferase [Christiangramia sp. OXR-203]|uniref:glycosyltransferase n=1 Tax=Christiangramia sp. OXR-203 TaxID=3100176 RepID=UPI002AC8EC76|nr:glycosyltransferase [Christiangramia sp. OXR-203]WPY97908.1 glycosyltransferase [Christiangramia sp. OXR-203]
MLSIIVCSVNPDLLKNLRDNIANTIGIDSYEFLCQYNAYNEGIAIVYNRLLKRAKNDIVLCIHEDIKFHTQDWGRLLTDYFEDDARLGLLGIAGSKTKTKTPTGWWENEPDNWVMNLIQHYNSGKTQRIDRGFANALEEVVVIDGVFVALHKDSRLEFDERIHGFHNYDQAISMRCRNKGYKIKVTREILIEHFSSGSKGDDWKSSNQLFFNLYKSYLPQSIKDNRVRMNENAYSYMRLINNHSKKNKLFSIIYWIKYWKIYPREKKTYRLLKQLLES